MRSAFVILSFLAVLVSGFWAYRENYATKEALRSAGRLKAEISQLQETLAVQRAEWAYLNRPDRLSELAAANFERLGLMPMRPQQFATTREVPMPAVLEGVEGLAVVSTLSAEAEALLP